MSERERLDRLVKDGRVVGYQKQEGGKIYHQNIRTKNRYWFNILDKGFAGECANPNYIPHDRIDQYTGIDIARNKVFERDEFKTRLHGFKGVVTVIRGQWFIDWEWGDSRNPKPLYGCPYGKGLIGIQGVTK